MKYLPDAATELVVNLGVPRSFDDLDGDGAEDAIIFLVVDPGGSGTFHYMVAVLNEDGTPVPQAPKLIGDRIFVRSIEIESGVIHLEIATHGPEAPFCCLDTISRRTYSLEGGGLQLEEQADSPMTDAGDLPYSSPERIDFPSGTTSATVQGKIDLREVDRYQFQAFAGQRVTVTVTSPKNDVFLSLRGITGGPVLQPIVAEATSFSGIVSISQDYGIALATPEGSPVDYTLQIDMTGDPEPTPTAAPTATPPLEPTSPPPQTGEKVIYLTFDDGQATPYTAQILEVLAQYDARATFFILGQQLARFPDARQAQVSAGHTLANHTWGHLSLDGIGRQMFFEEILRTQELLGADATLCLRPPYGAADAFTRVWAEEVGLRIVMWDIDTRDWARPGVPDITSSILSNAHPGAIILMHDGGGNRSQTVDALDAALSELSEQGYRFEPICHPSA